MQPRALIVDDEPQTCELIQSVVNSVGMHALILNSSAKAPALLGRGRFDLVFLDFHMTSPDGVELARQVRQSRPNRTSTIVLVSDDQRPSALTVGFEAGASLFLYKPIDRDRLARLVRATQGLIEQEKRRMRRVPVKQKVMIRFGGQDVEAETVDMSLNGVLVKAHRAFAPGSTVRLSMQLGKETRPMTGVGSVVRIIGSDQMGIQFDRLSVADSERLQGFLLPMISRPGS